MPSLARELRRELERTVKEARRVAEVGAEKAIDRLGVGDASPPAGLSPAGQSLRERLRAHGRQLGDRRERSGKQATARLIAECAYENWHRMLFARFLAENDLLIEPTHGVPITLDECKELARSEAVDWLELASSYAVRMLPQIFRPGDPVLDVSLPPETRSQLEDLLKALPADTFKTDDSLGWVYQFWQAERKEEVNASEIKIGADELPAVTQLFTEDYMVLFLLHNTLGAWWAGKILAARPEHATTAQSEDELRAACAVGGVEWTYLRFVREGDGPWRPAAGTFDGWPKTAREITVLDPCMGSGHFLVFALPILVALRMAEEGLSREAAVEAVLRDNLFGLEIDPRCTQIAAFNLALAAWRMVGHRQLPALNLACSGLAPSASLEEWLKLAERAKSRLPRHGFDAVLNGLENLHTLFSQAPTLGSLIDPRELPLKVVSADYETLLPFLDDVFQAEGGSDEQREQAVAAAGMVKAAELLASEYTLVVTNVPYLGKGSHDEIMMQHAAELDPNAASDLAYMMLVRIDRALCQNGTCALVIPQAWMFLNSYRELRKHYLSRRQFQFVARLGPGAFEQITGEVVQCALTVISRAEPSLARPFSIVDAAAKPGEPELSVSEKQRVLLGVAGSDERHLRLTTPHTILDSPSSKFSFSEVNSEGWLSEFADSYVGLQTGDSPRWIQQFWEQSSVLPAWMLFQLSPSRTTAIDGCTAVLRWDLQDELRSAPGSRVQGLQAIGQLGVLVQRMADLKACVYAGYGFDTNTAVLIPKTPSFGSELLQICSHESYAKIVRDRAPGLSITNRALIEIPFERRSNEGQSTAVVDLAQLLQTNDPTQWLFHGRPEESISPLQVAVARLLGYRWPAELGPEMRLSHRARALVARCEELASHVDADGIVCLSSIKGEPAAATRVNALLAAAFGKDWSAGKLDSLLADVGFAGKSLDVWLRDGFFENHCDVFHQRPFVWHIWDGRQDGFHALVNYHRLAAPNGEGRRTLERLIYSYLGDWIVRQRNEQKNGVDGAEARLAAAEHLKSELEKILAGEPPYDLFVRWKSLHEQPIGWGPDINDGVRMNIRPFMTARPLGARARGACILRTTPRIKWDKDRGKEPQREKEEFPWFWGWDEETNDFAGGRTFDGNRWNNLHYSTAFKQKARERHAKSAAREAKS